MTKSCCFFFVFVFLWGVSYNTAFAHATPISQEPPSGANLEKMPDIVQIRFSERIEARASSIIVSDAFGRPISEEAFTDPSDAYYFKTLLRGTDSGTDNGTYTVSWRAVSADDGHFSKGAFLFTVGAVDDLAPPVSGQLQIQHLTSLPEAILGFLSLVGRSVLAGALFLLIFLFPFVLPFKELAESNISRFKKYFTLFVYAGICIAFIGDLGFIILKTFDLQQLHAKSFWETFELFLSTSSGAAGSLRIILDIFFFSLFAFLGKKIYTLTWPNYGAGMLAFILLVHGFTKAFISHAAASLILPKISIVMMFFHLFFKEMWVGSLLVLLLLILPLLSKSADRKALLLSLVSFSRYASVFFGVVGATGAYIVWLHLKDFSYLRETEWGGRFVILLLVATGFAALRFLSQCTLEKKEVFRFVKKVPRPINTVLDIFTLSLVVETGLGLVLLFFSSYVSITTPPFTLEKYAFTESVISQDTEIAFSLNEYESGKFLISFVPESEEPVELKTVSVFLENKGDRIGPLSIQPEKRSPYRYVFGENVLTPPGEWEVLVYAEPVSGYDLVGKFTLNYPEDVLRSKVIPEERSFGFFDFCMLSLGFLAVLFSFLLFKASTMLQKRLLKEHLSPPASSVEEETPSFSPKKAYVLGVAGIVSFLILIAYFYYAFSKTEFEVTCRGDGNFWIQSTPLYNGKVTSLNTATGCTLQVGLYHFSNFDEYTFFKRQSRTNATLAISPSFPQAGTSTDLLFSLTNTEDNKKIKPAEDLTMEHDRLLHVLIIGEDLNTFAHIHAEDLGGINAEALKNGEFRLRYVFPKAGEYTILLNYVVRGARDSKQFFVGVSGTPLLNPFLPPLQLKRVEQVQQKNFGDYRVTLTLPKRIQQGKTIKLKYYVEKNGIPIRALEPYLGAAMHIGVIRDNLLSFSHTHGEVYLPGSAFVQSFFQGYVNFHSHFVPDRFGPKIQARLVFNEAGIYKVFGEFQHEGKVIVSDFLLQVE